MVFEISDTFERNTIGGCERESNMFCVALIIGNYNKKVNILSTAIALVIYRCGIDCYAGIFEAQVIYISELFDKRYTGLLILKLPFPQYW